LADYQREATFGGRRMCSQKNRGGNHQLEQRVTEHDATSGNAGYGLVTAPEPKVQAGGAM
jgi:hypothetical protein